MQLTSNENRLAYPFVFTVVDQAILPSHKFKEGEPPDNADGSVWLDIIHKDRSHRQQHHHHNKAERTKSKERKHTDDETESDVAQSDREDTSASVGEAQGQLECNGYFKITASKEKKRSMASKMGGGVLRQISLTSSEVKASREALQDGNSSDPEIESRRRSASIAVEGSKKTRKNRKDDVSGLEKSHRRRLVKKGGVKDTDLEFVAKGEYGFDQSSRALFLNFLLSLIQLLCDRSKLPLSARS